MGVTVRWNRWASNVRQRTDSATPAQLDFHPRQSACHGAHLKALSESPRSGQGFLCATIETPNRSSPRGLKAARANLDMLQKDALILCSKLTAKPSILRSLPGGVYQGKF